jgi:hypothetical protein
MGFALIAENAFGDFAINIRGSDIQLVVDRRYFGAPDGNVTATPELPGWLYAGLGLMGLFSFAYYKKVGPFGAGFIPQL